MQIERNSIDTFELLEKVDDVEIVWL